MKKIILIIFFILISLNSGVSYGVETEEVIKEQEEKLGISKFIKTADEYTKESFEDIDISEIYKGALTGSISTEGILKRNI